MVPGWIDAENMIPEFIKDLESSESEGPPIDLNMVNAAKIGGKLSKNKLDVDFDGKGMQTINEEDNEGSLNNSLPGLDAIFDQANIQTQGSANDEEYGLHDFNEDDHAEILDKLSLMDRDRYLELLKLKHKYSNMKADLI